MRERSFLSLSANYALVIAVEVVVIALLWYIGRYFG